MNISQDHIVLLIFIVAIGYLVWHFYRRNKSKSCGGGCNACSTIDFKKIEADIALKNQSKQAIDHGYQQGIQS